MTRLIDAINSNDLELTRLLIESREEINTLDISGNSPLIYAAMHGLDDVVTQLITAGADLNIPDARGMTPIARAASNGYDNIVQQLITAGADIDTSDFYDITPIAHAASNGHENIVQRLIAAGADTNTPDVYEMTPIANAVSNGHKKTFKLLLSYGALGVNDTLESLLIIAVKAEDPKISIINKLLMAGANLRGASGKEILEACKTDIAKKIIQDAMLDAEPPRSPRPR